MLHDLPNLLHLSVHSVGSGERPSDRATDNIVGLLQVTPPVMITLKGLLQHLQLCQVNKRYYRSFNCNDKAIWKSLLEYAASRTITNPNPIGVADSVKLVPTVAEVDALASTLNDEQASTVYKRAFIQYVIYRNLWSFEVFSQREDFQNERWFNLIWFKSQVDIFLGRRNGSIPRVVKEIRSAVASLRRDDPTYPRIPADFFVSALTMVKTAYDAEPSNFIWRGRNSVGGDARVPELIAAIRATAYY